MRGIVSVQYGGVRDQHAEAGKLQEHVEVHTRKNNAITLIILFLLVTFPLQLQSHHLHHPPDHSFHPSPPQPPP
jgi:fumarate reductase subunit D